MSTVDRAVNPRDETADTKRRSPDPERRQGVRRGGCGRSGGARLQPRHRRRRDLHDRRALGLRQDDIAECHRRLSQHHARHHLARRRGALRTGQAEGRARPDRVVVFQNGALFPWKTQPRERRFRAGDAGSHDKGRRHARRRASSWRCRAVGDREAATRARFHPACAGAWRSCGP